MFVSHKAIDWDDVELGARSDTVFARQLGVAPQVVWAARRRRGIPAFAGDQLRRRRAIDWEAVGLGLEPDAAIAIRLGVERRVVATERAKRGIAPFIGIVLNQEGEPCRSLGEAMYDSWLHSQDLAHAHEVTVPELPYRADFLVGSTFVEIVGMATYSRYREKLERKREVYAAAAVAVTWLEPTDVQARFSESTVPLRFRAERRCLDCARVEYDLVRQVCRRCYMHRWHDTGDLVSCLNCGVSFPTSEGRQYCSRECYWRRNEKFWPSWDELDDRLRHRSVAQVARELGVKPSVLYMRIRRRTA